MDKSQLVAALSARLPSALAHDLVDEFLRIRQDVITRTLGGAAPGKFVETVVQALQFIDTGGFDAKPSVDDYLRTLESKPTKLDEGLKMCAARIARAVYTLRNKRNIAHKGEVDPNEYDLRFILSAAQWMMAEFVRHITGGTMAVAGEMIEQVQAPAGWLIEDFGDKKLVLSDLTVLDEVLILIHSGYPNAVSRELLAASLQRRDASSIRKAIKRLWEDKQIEYMTSTTIGLTKKGFGKASELLRQAANVAA